MKGGMFVTREDERGLDETKQAVGVGFHGGGSEWKLRFNRLCATIGTRW